MKHRLIAFLALIALLIPLLAVPAAAASRGIVLSSFSADLDISSGGTATCSCSARASGCTISVAMKLQRYQNGSWTTLKTWSANQSSPLSLSGTKTVASGYNYRVSATCSVYNSSGSFVESATTYSASKYY